MVRMSVRLMSCSRQPSHWRKALPTGNDNLAGNVVLCVSMQGSSARDRHVSDGLPSVIYCPRKGYLANRGSIRRDIKVITLLLPQAFPRRRRCFGQKAAAPFFPFSEGLER